MAGDRNLTDQEAERLRKLGGLRGMGEDPFSIEKVDVQDSVGHLIGEYGHLDRPTLDSLSREVYLLGRVTSIRQSFFTLRDSWETLQAYVPRMGECPRRGYYDSYLDMGDLVWVRGTLFKTNRNELTVRVSDLRIVSKCLNVFPSEYYGIRDREIQVRDRVAHFLTSKDAHDTLVLRSRIISLIRSYLNGLGYMEVETPILESVYGGANAVPFRTFYEGLGEDYFLRIAPEISLKKLVIAGFHRVYEIGKVFRNEGMDTTHNPEFTSLEIYTANFGLGDVMDLTENIILHIANGLQITSMNWNDSQISLEGKFRRAFLPDLVREKVGQDFYGQGILLEDALSLAQRHGIALKPHEETVGHIFHRLFEELVEPELIQPTLVHGFHRDVSPLAKLDPNNPNFTLRYELYIGSREFANGFAELNDPIDQLERFESQRAEREGGNREAFDVDRGYIRAMGYGLIPTGGIGIGVDRLVMLFSGKNSIKDVMFFPQIKRED